MAERKVAHSHIKTKAVPPRNFMEARAILSDLRDRQALLGAVAGAMGMIDGSRLRDATIEFLNNSTAISGIAAVLMACEMELKTDISNFEKLLETEAPQC